MIIVPYVVTIHNSTTQSLKFSVPLALTRTVTLRTGDTLTVHVDDAGQPLTVIILDPEHLEHTLSVESEEEE